MEMKPRSRREELNALARRIGEEKRAQIRAMTRDEKYSELNDWYQLAGVLNLDLDQLKRDQFLLGLPDTVLDEAVAICRALAGKTWGTLPMTPEEGKKHIANSEYLKYLLRQADSRRGLSEAAGPPFSLRKSGESGLARAARRRP